MENKNTCATSSKTNKIENVDTAGCEYRSITTQPYDIYNKNFQGIHRAVRNGKQATSS